MYFYNRIQLCFLAWIPGMGNLNHIMCSKIFIMCCHETRRENRIKPLCCDILEAISKVLEIIR